ncbi:hypothetical protein C8F01DRAFT_1084242 [Mycena amicta]|nr:hypothetical protein C8F01DRAFT_1084242 [Mycena amicta]
MSDLGYAFPNLWMQSPRQRPRGSHGHPPSDEQVMRTREVVRAPGQNIDPNPTEYVPSPSDYEQELRRLRGVIALAEHENASLQLRIVGLQSQVESLIAQPTKRDGSEDGGDRTAAPSTIPRSHVVWTFRSSHFRHPSPSSFSYRSAKRRLLVAGHIQQQSYQKSVHRRDNTTRLYSTRPPICTGTGAVVTKLKTDALDILADMASQRILPTYDHTYSALGLVAKDTFRARIEARYPDLRLCDSHWKADYVATTIYNNWKTSPRGKAHIHTIKVEDEQELATERPLSKPKVTSTSTVAPKKRKSTVEHPAAPSNKRRNDGEAEPEPDLASVSVPPQEPKKRLTIKNPTAQSRPHTKKPIAPVSPNSTIHLDSASAPSPGTNNMPPPINLPKRSMAPNNKPAVYSPKAAATRPRPRSSASKPVASSSAKQLTPPPPTQTVHPPAVSPPRRRMPSQRVAGSKAKPYTEMPSSPLSPSSPAPEAPVPITAPSKARRRTTNSHAPDVPKPTTTAAGKSKGKKKKTWAPGKAVTAENLCAAKWLQDYPEGAREEFDLYWRELAFEKKAPWFERQDSMEKAKHTV